MQDASPARFTVITGTRTIAQAQMLLMGASSLFFYFLQGQAAAEAALYGGAMALFNLWVAYRQIDRATALGALKPEQEAVIFYVGAAIRFVFTLGFFFAGLALLNLPPLALIAGFALAQLGYVFRGRT